MVDRGSQIREAIQKNLEASPDFDAGDVVVDFVVVASIQNFETGHVTSYFTDSAPEGRGLPADRAKGMLVNALDMIRLQEFRDLLDGDED